MVFKLLEQSHGEAFYDQNVRSYLELMRVPYTGCSRAADAGAGQGPVEEARALSPHPGAGFRCISDRPQNAAATRLACR